MKERKEIYNQIKKVIEDCTNLDGYIKAEHLKTEILVEVFPDITDEEIIP